MSLRLGFMLTVSILWALASCGANDSTDPEFSSNRSYASDAKKAKYGNKIKYGNKNKDSNKDKDKHKNKDSNDREESLGGASNPIGPAAEDYEACLADIVEINLGICFGFSSLSQQCQEALWCDFAAEQCPASLDEAGEAPVQNPLLTGAEDYDTCLGDVDATELGLCFGFSSLSATCQAVLRCDFFAAQCPAALDAADL